MILSLAKSLGVDRDGSMRRLEAWTYEYVKVEDSAPKMAVIYEVTICENGYERK